jgi:hypothetical protein
MTRSIGLAATAMALAVGTVATSAAEARITFNRISLNRIAFNRISFNGSHINRTAAKAHSNGSRTDQRPPGEGSVNAVTVVQLPAK